MYNIVKVLLMVGLALVVCLTFVSVADDYIESNYSSITKITDLHNEHRKSIEVPTLIGRNELNEYAQNHAKVMASFGLRHSSLRFKGMYRAENIGFSTEDIDEDMFEGWLNSINHRNNIESVMFNRIGVGKAKSRRGYYWCVVFSGDKLN